MATQKSKKDSGTFTAKIVTNFVATNVTLHKFTGVTPGGYISGEKDKGTIYIGFPPGMGDDQRVTKQYPDDFTDNYMEWTFHDGENKHQVKTGWITVTFTENMKNAKGEFECSIDDPSPRTITGEFDIQG